MKVFIDSNVPMYVAGRDHPLRDPARRILDRVQRGELDACTSTEVLQEILFRYWGLKRMDVGQRVYDLFVQICPVVLPVTLADTDRAKAILTSNAAVSARDAVHAAVMLNHDVSCVATFDRGFDSIPGLSRLTSPGS